MSIHNLTSLSEKMQELRNQGYHSEFRFRQGKLLNEKGVQFTPRDITIENELRFEGESNPSDSSILYVLETRNGERGLIANAYGAKSNAGLEKFLQQASSR